MLFVSSKPHTAPCLHSRFLHLPGRESGERQGRARGVGASETVEEVLLSGTSPVKPNALREQGLCLSFPR